MATIQETWRVVAASVMGTSHLKTGQPCQDAYQVERLPDDSALLIAVADGAGSALYAQEGAALVVARGLETARERLTEQAPPTDEAAWAEMMRAAFQAARAALCTHVEETDHELRDYAATLMLVVLTDEWTVAGLIGDVIAVGLAESGALSSLCKPQKGEYINTTYFITQEEALDMLDVVVRREPLAGVAVFSDGLLELALNVAQNKPHPPFFEPLFAFAAAAEDEAAASQQLRDFLDSERVNARTDDDKTLVLARRLPA